MRHALERIASLAGSNFGLKVVAVVIALGLWLAGHRDIERTIEAPIEFRNLPADLMVADQHVDYVVLRVSGPRTLVSTLDSDEMKVSLDLKNARPGAANYPLSSNSFNIPRGVTVARITPPVVNLTFEPVLVRSLPVAVRFTGEVPEGYMMASSTADPKTVSVRGPAEDVRNLAFIETDPIDLEPGRLVISRRVRLSTSGKALVFSPDQVLATLVLQEEQAIREFKNVPVAVKNAPGEYRIRPKTATIQIAGPKSVVGGLEVGDEGAYVDLKDLGAGDHVVALALNLPEKVKILEAKPRQFKVRIFPRNRETTQE